MSDTLAAFAAVFPSRIGPKVNVQRKQFRAAFDKIGRSACTEAYHRPRSVRPILKDRPATLVTVIGSGLVALDDGGLAMTIYTYEKGSIGFRLSQRAIDVLRETLDEAEGKLAHGERADRLTA